MIGSLSNYDDHHNDDLKKKKNNRFNDQITFFSTFL